MLKLPDLLEIYRDDALGGRAVVASGGDSAGH